MSVWQQSDAMKAQHWAIAKGHLQALVDMQGCYSSEPESHESHEMTRWFALEAAVKQFVEDVESRGLAE